MAGRPRLPPLHQALDFDNNGGETRLHCIVPKPTCLTRATIGDLFSRPANLRTSRSTFNLQAAPTGHKYSGYTPEYSSQTSLPPFDAFHSGPSRSRSTMQLREPFGLSSFSASSSFDTDAQLAGSSPFRSRRTPHLPPLAPLTRSGTPSYTSAHTSRVSGAHISASGHFGSLDEGFAYGSPGTSRSADFPMRTPSRSGTPSLPMDWDPSSELSSRLPPLRGYNGLAQPTSPPSAYHVMDYGTARPPRRPASDPSMRSALSTASSSPLDRTFRSDVLTSLPPLPRQDGVSALESRVPLPPLRKGPSSVVSDLDSIPQGRERNAHGWEPGTGPPDADWVAAMDGSGSRVYPCPYCGKVFPRPSARKVHLVVHVSRLPSTSRNASIEDA